MRRTTISLILLLPEFYRPQPPTQFEIFGGVDGYVPGYAVTNMVLKSSDDVIRQYATVVAAIAVAAKNQLPPAPSKDGTQFYFIPEDVRKCGKANATFWRVMDKRKKLDRELDHGKYCRIEPRSHLCIDKTREVIHDASREVASRFEEFELNQLTPYQKELIWWLNALGTLITINYYATQRPINNSRVINFMELAPCGASYVSLIISYLEKLCLLRDEYPVVHDKMISDGENKVISSWQRGH